MTAIGIIIYTAVIALVFYSKGYHDGREDERYQWRYFQFRQEDDDGEESEEET